VGLIKVARVGSELVIVERYGDLAKGKPRRFTAYRVKKSRRELLPEQIKWAALQPDVAPGAQWMMLVGPLDYGEASYTPR